jgi:hypothetical protein
VRDEVVDFARDLQPLLPDSPERLLLASVDQALGSEASRPEDVARGDRQQTEDEVPYYE